MPVSFIRRVRFMAPIWAGHKLRNSIGHGLKAVDAVCGTTLYTRYDRARTGAVVTSGLHNKPFGLRLIWQEFKADTKTPRAS